MNRLEKVAHGQKRRELMAYYKIALGMTIKECAFVMGITFKNADFYWRSVKERIRSAQHSH